MQQLAIVGMRRCPTFPPRNHCGGILSLVTYFGNRNIDVGNCFSFVFPSLTLFSHLVPIEVTPLACNSVRRLSSKKSPGMSKKSLEPKIVSIMEHLKYKEMYEMLSETVRVDSNLGPLETACFHIL